MSNKRFLFFEYLLLFLLEVSQSQEVICIQKNSASSDADASSNCVYRPPSTKEFFNQVMRNISELMRQMKSLRMDLKSCRDIQININGQIESLKMDLKASRVNQINITANLTASLRRGYVKLGNGWMTPFNGFQYKTTPTNKTGHESRADCQNWDADLAHHGVQDVGIRQILNESLALEGTYWIGLTDEEDEGIWRWMDGRRSNVKDASLWNIGRPRKNHENQDCVHAYFGANPLYVDEVSCSRRMYQGLCEKRI